MKATDTNHIRLIGKINTEVERDYAEYQSAKADILKAWETEEKPEQKRFDMVTVSEDHNWHPHETM